VWAVTIEHTYHVVYHVTVHGNYVILVLPLTFKRPLALGVENHPPHETHTRTIPSRESKHIVSWCPNGMQHIQTQSPPHKRGRLTWSQGPQCPPGSPSDTTDHSSSLTELTDTGDDNDSDDDWRASAQVEQPDKKVRYIQLQL
jgi:hypothetical protein